MIDVFIVKYYWYWTCYTSQFMQTVKLITWSNLYLLRLKYYWDINSLTQTWHVLVVTIFQYFILFPHILQTSIDSVWRASDALTCETTQDSQSLVTHLIWGPRSIGLNLPTAILMHFVAHLSLRFSQRSQLCLDLHYIAWSTELTNWVDHWH